MVVAVDVAVFTVQRARLELLLIQMRRPPFEGSWALPGGRIAADESVEEAAARELAEKTGLSSVYLEQLYTFSAPERDPAGRVLSVAHLALIPPTEDLRCPEKYSEIGWFPADRPPPLAFDHGRIVPYAVRRLRAKLAWTNVAYSLLPETFTLGELQRVYEAILGRPLDPRNFRKRIVAVGLVEETGEMRTGQRHRPGRLFRFTVRRPIEIDVL
jgi:ADP-ribose pyrophosphatase YjhB (NUDIX family)